MARKTATLEKYASLLAKGDAVLLPVRPAGAAGPRRRLVVDGVDRSVEGFALVTYADGRTMSAYHPLDRVRVTI